MLDIYYEKNEEKKSYSYVFTEFRTIDDFDDDNEMVSSARDVFPTKGFFICCLG